MKMNRDWMTIKQCPLDLRVILRPSWRLIKRAISWPQPGPIDRTYLNRALHPVSLTWPIQANRLFTTDRWKRRMGQMFTAWVVSQASVRRWIHQIYFYTFLKARLRTPCWIWQIRWAHVICPSNRIQWLAPTNLWLWTNHHWAPASSCRSRACLRISIRTASRPPATHHLCKCFKCQLSRLSQRIRSLRTMLTKRARRSGTRRWPIPISHQTCDAPATSRFQITISMTIKTKQQTSKGGQQPRNATLSPQTPSRQREWTMSFLSNNSSPTRNSNRIRSSRRR